MIRKTAKTRNPVRKTPARRATAGRTRTPAKRRSAGAKSGNQMWRMLNNLQVSLFRTRKTQKKQTATQKKAIRKNKKAIRQIRWISIPGAFMGAVALVYLFYVVHVMERSMSSISTDIHHMEGYIAGISQDTYTMSRDMHSMSRGVGTMSRAAEPMSRMRRMMPF